MTIFLKGLLALLLPAALTLVAVLRIRKKNLPLEMRSLQLPYFICAVVLAVAFCALEGALILLLDKLLSIAFLGRFITWLMPAFNYGTSFMLITLSYLNILFLFALDAALAILRPIVIKRELREEDDGHCALELIIIERFYRTDRFAAVLKPRGYIARAWLGAMKNVMLAAYGLCLVALFCMLALPWSIIGGISESLYLGVFKAIYLVPMLSYCLIYEFEAFLCAPEEQPDAAGMESDIIGKRLIGSYRALMQVYARKLHTSLLALTQTTIKPDAARLYNSSTDDIRAACDPARLSTLTALEDTLKSRGVPLHEGLLSATVTLLNGGNVMLVDSLAGDAGEYVCEYADVTLAPTDTMLVICSGDDSPARIKALLERRFTRTNLLAPMWSVATGEEAPDAERFHILVCTDAQAPTLRLGAENADFFSRVRLCVFTNAAALYMGAQHVKKSVSALLVHSKPQYIFLSPSKSTELENSIESDIGAELEVFDGACAQGETDLVLWRDESYCAPEQVIGAGNELYIGTALPIVLLSLKYGVRRADILPDAATPYHTYYEAMMSHMTSIRKKLYGDDVNAIDVTRAVKYDSLGAERPEIAFTVAHDTDNNLISRLDTLMRLGGTQYTMLHIIARPYMLREYFTANLDAFLCNRSIAAEFTAFDMDMCDSDAFALLTRMYSSNVRESAIQQRIRRSAGVNTATEDYLLGLLEKLCPGGVRAFAMHFSCRDISEFRADKNGGRYAHDMLIRFTDAELYARLAQRFAPALMLCDKHPDGMYLEVCKGDIYSYCLPGQLIVLDDTPGADGFGGTAFSVSRIDRDEGRVYAAETNNVRLCEYASLCSFAYGSIPVARESAERRPGCYTAELFTVDATRTITGYVELTNGSDLIKPGNTPRRMFDPPLTDRVSNAEMLRITLEGENAALAAATLSVMLNGAFKTLFPKSYKCLFACRDSSAITVPQEPVQAAALELYPTITRAHGDTAGANTIDIIEYSSADHGAVRALRALLPTLWRLLRRYTAWALEKDSPASYLKFGLGEYPEFVRLDLVDSFLNTVCPEVANFTEEQLGEAHISALTNCSFCGREILTAAARLEEGENGRVMCVECERAAVTRMEEAEKLFNEAREILERTYNIKLARNISVKLKSADNIRKRHGHTAGGRVLGFYSPRLRQLWAERGGPGVAMLSTLIHELTHCWQCDCISIRNTPLEMLEGHAVYVEVEAMKVAHQTAYAQRVHELTIQSDDEYGRGYRAICEAIKDYNGSVFEYMKEKYPK